jgi:transcription initiation factor TFIIIB Brf1 subunit/transcription initiation factor TFIIB
MHCRDCGSDDFVENYAEGDTICKGCGLVASERNSYDLVSYNKYTYDDYEPLPRHYQESTTKLISKDMEEKLKACVIHLNLPDTIEQEAKTLLEEIKYYHTFKGYRSNSVVACAIYLSCNKFGQTGARDSKEVYESVGIDSTTFHATLRDIYEIKPDLNKIHNIQNTDTLRRQIRQSLEEVQDNDKVYELARTCAKLEEERRRKKLLMGSPPFVVNAVLIFVAAEALNIKINKNVYVQKSGVSRATLDKHVATIKTKCVLLQKT